MHFKSLNFYPFIIFFSIYIMFLNFCAVVIDCEKLHEDLLNSFYFPVLSDTLLIFFHFFFLRFHPFLFKFIFLGNPSNLRLVDFISKIFAGIESFSFFFFCCQDRRNRKCSRRVMILCRNVDNNISTVNCSTDSFSTNYERRLLLVFFRLFLCF